MGVTICVYRFDNAIMWLNGIFLVVFNEKKKLILTKKYFLSIRFQILYRSVQFYPYCIVVLFRLVLQIVICFFSFVKKTGVYRKNQQGYTRQSLIAIHERKRSRLNYWKPFLSREISIVLVIAWYIKIELLRTKQLPSYITFNGIDRVPSLTKNIEKEASKVYSLMFKNDDDVHKFFFADTGNRTLDGKIGKAKSFNYDLNCYNAEIVPKRGLSDSVPSVVSISTENMEPFKRIVFRKYKHISSKEYR